jgi:alanyl-tRNA synthetase
LALSVDAVRRRAIMANHTTTHVMNRALRMHVNENADQKGSLVDDEKLRFDFSQNSALTDEQLAAVEKMVNDDIAADLPVYFDFVPQEQGKAINGLRAVFGEKYPPKVRVVSIGVPVKDLVSDPSNSDWPKYSIEFCGGTHLAKTGDAEGFVILSEESVSKGVRRITAATGAKAHKISAEGEALLHRVQSLSGAPVQDMDTKLEQLLRAVSDATLPALIKSKVHAGIADLSRRQKEYQKAEGNKAAEVVIEIARELADKVTGPVIVEAIEGANGESIRVAMDILRKKHPEAALLLGGVAEGKIAFIASVPKPLIEKGLKAGDWVREVAKVAGGGGGGRPDMAQAGGKDPEKLDEALEAGRGFAAGKV